MQVAPVAQPSEWQRAYTRFRAEQLALLEQRTAERAPAIATGK
ncbi:hypothetical protein BMMON2_35850 [Burkholderia mallei]